MTSLMLDNLYLGGPEDDFPKYELAIFVFHVQFSECNSNFFFGAETTGGSSESQWGFWEMVARQEFLSDSDALVRLQK